MEIYRTPNSAFSESELAKIKLYKVSGIGCATYVGSIPAGGLLLYLNYRKLGLEKNAKQCLLISAIASILFFSALLYVYNYLNFPIISLVVASAFVVAHIAGMCQGKLQNAHFRKGGGAASDWKAFGMGLLVSFPLMLFFIALSSFGS